MSAHTQVCLMLRVTFARGPANAPPALAWQASPPSSPAVSPLSSPIAHSPRRRPRLSTVTRAAIPHFCCKAWRPWALIGLDFSGRHGPHWGFADPPVIPHYLRQKHTRGSLGPSVCPQMAMQQWHRTLREPPRWRPRSGAAGQGYGTRDNPLSLFVQLGP